MQMREVHPPRRKSWPDRMAEKAALGLTRRSVICRSGYATAALLGARFLVADGPRALAKVATKPPPLCFDPNHPCAPDGLYCGLGVGSAPCSQMSSCKGCLQANGCPMGTSPEYSWHACCVCQANQNTGFVVTYTDCCGLAGSGYAFNHLAAPCQACFPTGLVAPGCIGANHPGTPWCSVIHSAYVCTVTSVGAACGPPINVTCDGGILHF